MEKQWQIEINNKPLIISTGKLAKQSSGSVLIRYGDTVVLVTATASAEPREGIDFFPLTVDFEERLYAVGKIPGGFIKREGRPSEKAILSSRLIDRPIRPLFPEGFRNDVQIVAVVLSADENPPEIPALVGASAALMVSDIPFSSPIGAVRVGRINGEFIINPTYNDLYDSELDLVIAGTEDAIMMVEAGSKEVSEEVMLAAMKRGHEVIKEIVAFQKRIVEEVGNTKRELVLYRPDEELESKVRDYATEKLKEAIKNSDKLAREEQIKEVKDETKKYFAEIYPDKPKDVSEVLSRIIKEEVRKMICIHKVRPDGRALDEIRPITCETGLLPRTHGSGLFTRGQTQVMTVATLGAVGDEQIIDGLGDDESKRYMHHYNFPPYSVGETRPLRGPGRREIGHGALAERALEPVLPSDTEFPYTIRLVSEVLESNGSTSMASVCGSTLSMMDAGVPIKAPVAGVAMGLMKLDEHVSILTDIQGMEDALGDMDFKVAGTEKGITAIQMDIKIKGISEEILQQALEQARKGRMFILNKMLEVIQAPKKELSPYAPRIITAEIDPDKIRHVIGPGGKTIRKIIEETGVKIDIEEDGRVFIASTNGEAGEKALKMIETLTKDVEVGEIYLGRVVKITNFGAFTEILPGKEGLVHISQLADERVNKVEDVLKVGDEVLVKVIDIDKQGKISLSRKAVWKDENNKENKVEK